MDQGIVKIGLIEIPKRRIAQDRTRLDDSHLPAPLPIPKQPLKPPHRIANIATDSN